MRSPRIAHLALLSVILSACSGSDAFTNGDAAGDVPRDRVDASRIDLDVAFEDLAFPDITLPPPAHLELAAGERHTCALRLDHTVWCWGANGDNQLGLAGADRTTPTRLDALPLASQVAAGARHTCALLIGGRVYCWGANDRFQCGRASRDPMSSAVPAPVAGLGVVVDLVAGASHTCARTNIGQVFCWGAGALGQLGTGSLTDSATPALVLDGAITLAAGGDHTCVTRMDRSVRCWGSNAERQLGVAANTRCGFGCEPLPVAVPSVANVTMLALGARHSCARMTSGAVSCWGDGQSGATGRLGGPSETPNAVSGFSNELSVYAGFEATCGVDTGTRVRCMGRNASNELGLASGASDRIEQPTEVSGLPMALEVAIGAHHACFAVGEAEVRCVGSNDYGQLGDGTTQRRASTVAVTFPVSDDGDAR